MVAEVPKIASVRNNRSKMKVQRGFQTELAPNNIQRTLFLKNAGAARYTYNWGLTQKKLAMDAKTKIPNNIELHRRLNALKPVELPWMYEVSKCAPQEALRNLDKAFDNFFRKCKAKKTGKHKGKLGFPRFKSKKKGIGGFRLTGTIKVMSDRIQLPRLGTIRLKERNYLPTDAKILNASVRERAGRWYVAVQVEMEMPEPPVKPVAIVGVDLGIKTLAVCSDSEVFENPKALGKNLKRLKKLGRLVSRKEKGSRNRRKAADRLAKFHKKISDIRKDTIHKITSHLTKTKSVVVIEDLNVSGMMKNHCLARAISDVGFHELRRQLEYKGGWYGCQVVVADRFFPSSKTCCECGQIKTDLTLSDRVYVCPCGNEIDRDLNAAINLERYITASSAGSYACGESSSGSTHKSRAKLGSLKQEMDRENGSPRFL
jgi:putative transposase